MENSGYIMVIARSSHAIMPRPDIGLKLNSTLYSIDDESPRARLRLVRKLSVPRIFVRYSKQEFSLPDHLSIF